MESNLFLFFLKKKAHIIGLCLAFLLAYVIARNQGIMSHDKSSCTLLNLRGTTDHNIPAELSIPELVVSIQIRTE